MATTDDGQGPQFSRFMDEAPSEAFGPSARRFALRRPPGFLPAVQRWSVLGRSAGLHVAFFGAEADSVDGLGNHPLKGWAARWLRDHPSGPSSVGCGEVLLPTTRATLVFAAYWPSSDRFNRWAGDADVEAWWTDPARLQGPYGCCREILHVPWERCETSYWRDFPRGLGLCPEVSLYPTPFCGYYGAMRDRLLVAALDPLAPEHEFPVAPRADRKGFGERWNVVLPSNLAVIRGGASWALMDPVQRADYEEALRGALHEGMSYLATMGAASGCLSLRFMRTVDADGNAQPEEHALGVFRSLADLENWAEGHATHRAIYLGAKARHRRFGPDNQLRTWHEVFVLPAGGRCEYLNCHPETGLIPWFAATRTAPA
ncbi:phenylacetaldoxime dehydratase family protein [Nostoc sp. NIES-2111]